MRTIDHMLPRGHDLVQWLQCPENRQDPYGLDVLLRRDSAKEPDPGLRNLGHDRDKGDSAVVTVRWPSVAE